MSDANETRGEITVALEEKEYALRPSYEAIVAIEAAAGRSLYELAQAAEGGSLTLDHAAIVVTECIRAEGKASGDTSLRNFSRVRVGEEILATGIMAVTIRVAILLGLAVTGGYTPTGERKAQATKPATPADA